MEIQPDTKDWTWVLERPCAECGLDTRTVDPADVAGMIRVSAAEWAALLRGGGDVRARPAPDVWSTLEYGAHVRDAFRIYTERLRLMETRDDPLFPNWDQDATAVAERYGEQDPLVVAAELTDAAEQLAAGFDAVTDWGRPGRRSDGAHFTTATFARYFIHDPLHHYRDVTGGTVPPVPPVPYPAIRQVVLDATDVRALAEFHRQLFGLEYRPGDEPRDPDDADWLVLHNPHGGVPLAFQQVDEVPRPTWPEGTVPQQLHLDSTVPDLAALDAQHRRAIDLGATLLLDRSEDEDEPLRVYADPAGHPFCIFVG